MVEHERVVAVGLLSERELAFVGQSLRRVYRVEEKSGFDDLLRAIDDAERHCETFAVKTRSLDLR